MRELTRTPGRAASGNGGGPGGHLRGQADWGVGGWGVAALRRAARRVAGEVVGGIGGVQVGLGRLQCGVLGSRGGPVLEIGVLGHGAEFEATGSPIISDGEQRWSSFATYPITDTLAGTGLAPTLGPGGQFFAIFADGHGRQLPKLERGPFTYVNYAAESLAKSLPHAHRPMKQAVIAPSMLALLYPLRDPVDGYSRDDFEAALIDECEKDIRQAFAAAPPASRSTSPRVAWPPARTRATRGRGRGCCRTSSS